MDPMKLDRALLRSLVDAYGYEDIAAELARRDGWPYVELDRPTGGVPVHDDYAACNIARKEDWLELYAKPFYFGCEADDRMNVTAFGRANPLGARINALFSSDIGHFDVPDMLHPVPEAHELVEDGLITPDDFRDFTFTNAVCGYGAPRTRASSRARPSPRRPRRCSGRRSSRPFRTRRSSRSDGSPVRCPKRCRIGRSVAQRIFSAISGRSLSGSLRRTGHVEKTGARKAALLL
jgi:hypothetical protein